MREYERSLPPRLAAAVGVRHVAITRGEARPEIESLFDEHCARHSVEANRDWLARGSLPWNVGNVGVLPGNIFEVGHCEYYDYLPAALAECDLLANVVTAHDPPERVGIRDWARWIERHPEPLDWRDRFYLEQRLAGWLSSSAQAGDVAGPEMVWIANSRRFITELLQFGELERRKGYHQHSVLKALSPELARFPVNVAGSRAVARLRRELHLLRTDRHHYFGRRVRAVAVHRRGRRLAAKRLA